jgi:TatA/E family protein of Tat protein translocase
MSSIGPWEIAIVVILALIIFGPKKLPELGQSLGKSIRGFKKGLQDNKEEIVSTVAQVREATGVDEIKSVVAGVREASGVNEVKATVAEIRQAANVKSVLSAGGDSTKAAVVPAKSEGTEVAADAAKSEAAEVTPGAGKGDSVQEADAGS